MDKYIVEKLRISYSSGRYDKLSLLLAYKDIVKGSDIEDILEYKLLPDIRSDLKLRILEVPIAQKYHADYQESLRKLIEAAEAMELSGSKHFPYQERKKVLDEILEDSISKLYTVTMDTIKYFYLECSEIVD